MSDTDPKTPPRPPGPEVGLMVHFFPSPAQKVAEFSGKMNGADYLAAVITQVIDFTRFGDHRVNLSVFTPLQGNIPLEKVPRNSDDVPGKIALVDSNVHLPKCI